MEGRRSAWRGIGVLIGVLAILAPAVYGAVTLVPPLPALEFERTALLEPVELPALALPLPAEGGSAIATDDGAVIATAGSTEPLPLAGAAKLVLVLMTLDAFPLEGDEQGPEVAIGSADVALYRDLEASGARVVPVELGTVWTQRELVAAVAVGAGNNVAGTLMRWAFASRDDYLVAAADWLESRGLTATTVVDETGLDPAGRSSASDLARLAAFASAHPVLSALYDSGGGSGPNGRAIDDFVSYRSSTGVEGLSRSYTDVAGVCLLFRVDVADPDGSPRHLVVAITGLPSYDALAAATDALTAAVPETLPAATVVTEGQVIGRLVAVWGATAEVVATREVVAVAVSGAVAAPELEVPERSSVREGATVAELRLEVGGVVEAQPLESTAAIRDPGLAWRLAHPGEMFESLLASLD